MSSKKNVQVTGIGVAIVFFIMLPVFFITGTWIFESLWNWLVPDLFNGPELTFWKAAGLMLLLSIIGGFFRGSSNS
jgi:hypothetical protein